MGVPKQLTEMQIKFAQLLVTNEGRKSPTECAIEAGYDKDSAHVRASELRNPNRYPLVVKYIGEIRDEYQKKYDVTYGRHITELARIRDEARVKGAWSAATNAEIARGKAAGLYIEQKIIHHNKVQDLTADELKAKMKKILDDNKGLIEADFAEVIETKKTIRYPRTNRKITVPKLTNDFTFVWSFFNYISLSTVFAYLNFFTQHLK
jgi:phage terminase small subunit